VAAFRRPALLSALAAAALLAGCGDDAEQVSAEELVGRGDELCGEGRQRFEEIQGEPPANAGEALEQSEELVEVASDELSELRRLRPPEELRERYDDYLEARGRALELLEQGRDAASDRDAAGYSEAQTRLAADEGERAKLARAVGFRVCSASGD